MYRMIHIDILGVFLQPEIGLSSFLIGLNHTFTRECRRTQKTCKNTFSLRNVDKDYFEVDRMITYDEKINLTYTILEGMHEPNRTELPPKTFVQFRLSPFEFSAMEKIAHFLSPPRSCPGFVPSSSFVNSFTFL